MKPLIKLFTEQLPLPLQAAALFVTAMFLYGMFVPSMVSANSTFAVWIGIAAIFVGGYVLWVFGKASYEFYKKETE